MCFCLCDLLKAIKYNPAKEEKEEREAKQKKLQEVEEARKKAQEPKGECQTQRLVPNGSCILLDERVC